MKVIKVVNEEIDGKLVSTFATWSISAEDNWQKEYAQGVETKPDVGYLFAYPRRSLKDARRDMGVTASGGATQFWIAEAEVVGVIRHCDISFTSSYWPNFWRNLKLQLQVEGAEYLLCSSITLTERLE